MQINTTRPTMKQSKCTHPAGAILRGIDPRVETCSRCGLVRVAHHQAPWTKAYEEAQAAQRPPDLVLISAPVPEMAPKQFRRKRGH